MEKAEITDIFGSESASSAQQQGGFRFFSGNLLALPVRSDARPYYMATTPGLIQSFIHTINQFGIEMSHGDLDSIKDLTSEKGHPLIGDDTPVHIEDLLGKPSPALKGLETLIGPNPALFHDEDFKDIASCLPVIARNNLENGESKNLWYEEIVPHQARFFCIIGNGTHHAGEFEKVLKQDIIQIGANASIGYGFTKITKFNGQGGFDE